MTSININKLYKQEIENLKNFLKLNKDFKINFYYKNKELKSFNKKTTLFLDTLFSSLICSNHVSNKDYDLYGNDSVLWKLNSYKKDNTVIIGKYCLFGPEHNTYDGESNKILWDSLLSKIDNPINRFKFLFNHEVGHLIQEENFDFHLINLSKEDNLILDKELKAILESNPELMKIINEVYADCFSIYLISNGMPETIKSWLNFIMNARINLCKSNIDFNSYNYLDIIPMFIEFSKNIPEVYDINVFNQCIKESITYGLIKTLHRHHLKDNLYHLNWNNYLQEEDILINKEKIKSFEIFHNKIYDKNGYLKMIKHELLTNYDLKEARNLGEKQLVLLMKDIELEEYSKKDENNKNIFNFIDNINYKEKNNLFNYCKKIINKFYYLPNGKNSKNLKI